LRPLDIAIAVGSLEFNPDPQKVEMLGEEMQLALQRQEISAQTYSEALALLAKVAGQSTASISPLA
jgi:hypothetical protein